MRYELSDHIGNVRTVFGVQDLGGQLTQAVYYAADYYPFGMVMPGRETKSEDYRYGFQGMEKDVDFARGSGNSYTTEFRQYDSRLGRWLTLDPLMAKYPGIAPYVAFNNNPVYFVDPRGLESDPPASNEPIQGTVVDENGNEHTYSKEDGVTLDDLNSGSLTPEGSKSHTYSYKSEPTTTGTAGRAESNDLARNQPKAEKNIPQRFGMYLWGELKELKEPLYHLDKWLESSNNDYEIHDDKLPAQHTMAEGDDQMFSGDNKDINMSQNIKTGNYSYSAEEKAKQPYQKPVKEAELRIKIDTLEKIHHNTYSWGEDSYIDAVVQKTIIVDEDTIDVKTETIRVK